jgi:ATP-dependent DNA ligase
MLLPINTIIDGELMEKRTKDIKDHFYAFDILFLNNQSTMHLTWRERRKLLEKTFRENDIYTDISEPIGLGFKTLYDLAIAEGDEGIVIKNVNSKYIIDLKSCPHNPYWVKAKKPENCFKQESK